MRQIVKIDSGCSYIKKIDMTTSFVMEKQTWR